MNTPVFPLRAGSFSARVPNRDTSGVTGQSKLWVLRSCCLRLETEEKEEEQLEEDVKAEEMSSRVRLGLEEQMLTRSEDSCEEVPSERRRRRGVCWMLKREEVEDLEAGVEVFGRRDELLRGGDEAMGSRSGFSVGEEVLGCRAGFEEVGRSWVEF